MKGLDTTDERLERLEAIEGVRNLKMRYAQVCDTGYDPDAMAPLFTEDARWDGGESFGVHEGVEAIRAFFGELPSSICGRCTTS